MKKIIYPIKIEKLHIGVTAPSSGLGSDVFNNRFDLIKQQHEGREIKVAEGECLRENNHLVSADRDSRAKDLHSLLRNEKVNFIQPPWGGNFLIDILDKLDFSLFLENPKWIQGYSDISTLLFAITTKTGVATAHGTNFIDSIEGQDSLTKNSRSYAFLEEGEAFIQKSSEKWQKDFVDFATKLDTRFNLTEDTKWRVLNAESAEFSGRIIGGCIDTIRNLVGTEYGDLKNFTCDYAKNDGVILYLENSGSTPSEVYRALNNMKYAGWFENINGVLFGRSNGPDGASFSYEDCIKQFFEGALYPVVLDADIGHLPPQMTIINGSYASLNVKDGKAELTQKFI